MHAHEERQIRRALAGHKIVLVGGDPRPHSIARLESELGLAAVIHCPTRKSDASAWRFLPKLLTERLVLVVCARGLTRTQHGSDLHVLCRDLGVLLLNCNHIPHPNALLAGIAKARLTSAVLARSSELTLGTTRRIGGAA